MCTDQQRWDTLGCTGNSSVSTPNIDRLAAEGALFRSCYTVNPVCAPSRASMVTGLYPYQHGLWANGVTLGPSEGMLVPRVQRAGYRTGLVGKWHLTDCFGGRAEDPSRYGFDWVRWAHDPSHAAPTNAYHAWLRVTHPDLFAEAEAAARATGGGRFRHEATLFDRMPDEAHYTRWVGDSAVEFIEGCAPEDHWLLWVNFFDPHHPFVAPEDRIEAVRRRGVPPPVGSAADLDGRPARLKDASRESYAGYAKGFQAYSVEELAYARAAYFAMIDLIDEHVGRLLAAAEAVSEPGELLVVFVSDHGEMLGDHGLILKGPMMYEGAMRIPCILRWPGHAPAGHVVDGLVSLLDVPTTVAAAAGAEPLAGSTGLDLVQVAAGSVEPDKVVFAEYRNSGHPYDPPCATSMVRSDRYKLVLWHAEDETVSQPTGELYDLEKDPGEMTNLWDDPEVVPVRAQLLGLMADCLAHPASDWGERRAFW